MPSTDARKYAHRRRRPRVPPLNPGHEWVGLVEGTRPESRADRSRMTACTVTRSAATPNSPSCPRGHGAGPAARRGSTPALPVERAVFLEPLADCLHAVHDQARVAAGDPVLVFSAGPMRIEVIAIASRVGASVLVVEPIAERREIARAFGAQQAVSPDEWRGAAETFAAGDGFAAVIVAVGKSALVAQAIEAAAPGGRVVAFAGFGNEPAAVIDMNRIHYGEVELVGSHWVGTPPNQHLDRYAQARDLLASPDLPLEQLVSWMIGFEQVEDALVRHADHRGLKTVLIPGQSR